MSAIVCRVTKIEPHIDPRTNEPSHSLEVVTLAWIIRTDDPKPGRPQQRAFAVIVTGPHYHVGQMGVYIAPGQEIPGYLAEDLWMVGSGGANRWFPVVEKNMRGINSPGIFCGQEYQKERGGPLIPWAYWRDRWREGEDVAAYLGVRWVE